MTLTTVTYEVQQLSMELAALLKDRLGPPSRIPDGDGGVQLEWHQNGWDLELWISRSDQTPEEES